jgi:hypothetical protein
MTHVDELLSIVPLFSRCTKKELAVFSRLTTKMTFSDGASPTPASSRISGKNDTLVPADT